MFVAQGRQGIQQVVDVEADGQTIHLGVGLDFFLRFFLLGIVGADLQLPGRHLDANAPVLFVGQDGGTLQGSPQYFPVQQHLAVRADRDHRGVIGEAAVDQLGGEGHIVALHANVAAADFQLKAAIAAFQQALQLGHALARDDDLALAHGCAFQLRLAHGQSVTIGRHTAQRPFAQVEEQTVEVVAHVLLGHGERGAFDQFLQRRFRHFDPLGRLDLVHRREIVGRQRRQGEPAAARLHGDLVPGLADGHLAAIGKGANDVEQLARGNRGFAILRVVDGAARNHLHFQIGTGQRQLAVLYLNQEVRQYRQRLPAFDHVDHLGQGLEESFALQTETHECWSPFALDFED